MNNACAATEPASTDVLIRISAATSGTTIDENDAIDIEGVRFHPKRRWEMRDGENVTVTTTRWARTSPPTAVRGVWISPPPGCGAYASILHGGHDDVPVPPLAKGDEVVFKTAGGPKMTVVQLRHEGDPDVPARIPVVDLTFTESGTYLQIEAVPVACLRRADGQYVVGDVVRLKSGGPWMTVEAIQERDGMQQVESTFVANGHQQYRTGVIPAPCLERQPQGNRAP